jgi:hypothetical protein
VEVNTMTKPKSTPEGKRSWRTVLPIHAAAELFPLMSEAELRELGEDIKKHGLSSPIVVLEDSKGRCSLLDGRSRLDSMERAGIPFELRRNDEKNLEIHLLDGWEPTGQVYNFGYDSFYVVTEYLADPFEYVVSANIARRHLTFEQRLELLDKVIKANPKMSARRAAKLAGVSPTTGTRRRTALEKSGVVSTVDTSTDTLGRRQPARKPRQPKPKPTPPQPSPEPSPELAANAADDDAIRKGEAAVGPYLARELYLAALRDADKRQRVTEVLALISALDLTLADLDVTNTLKAAHTAPPAADEAKAVFIAALTGNTHETVAAAVADILEELKVSVFSVNHEFDQREERRGGGNKIELNIFGGGKRKQTKRRKPATPADPDDAAGSDSEPAAAGDPQTRH